MYLDQRHESYKIWIQFFSILKCFMCLFLEFIQLPLSLKRNISHEVIQDIKVEQAIIKKYILFSVPFIVICKLSYQI